MIPQFTAFTFVAAALISGCSIPVGKDVSTVQPQQKVFIPHDIKAAEAQKLLSALGFDSSSGSAVPNSILINGSPDMLDRANAILDLIDLNEVYVVTVLAPASIARSLPSNEQIDDAIDGLSIGTFAQPPQSGPDARAIIDLHGNKVIAIAPESFIAKLLAVVKHGIKTAIPNEEIAPQKVQFHGENVRSIAGIPPDNDGQKAVEHVPYEFLKTGLEKLPAQRDEIDTPVQIVDGHSKNVSGSSIPPVKSGVEVHKTVNEDVSEFYSVLSPRHDPIVSRGVLKPSYKSNRSSNADNAPLAVSFKNGDDIVELSLPDKIGLVQLLDLVGEHLHLDCIYDPEAIKDQVVTLKLHSELRSELRVKDLYSLLETILKFNGLVMTRQKGNVVTIVPAAEALTVDPQLIDVQTRNLQAGDMIVTRVFKLQHVDIASVTNLLQNMKLSVSVSPLSETQTLLVTCYAHRMKRIEKLLEMVDHVGRPKEFRFRQLSFTTAGALTEKIRALTNELQSDQIVIAPSEMEPATTVSLSSQRARRPGGQQVKGAERNKDIYLDTDERTNRILMIGHADQLENVEALIDVLDVPQQDLRLPKAYDVHNMQAEDAMNKLEALQVLGGSRGPARSSSKVTQSSPSSAGISRVKDGLLTEEALVVVLEATNQLLINATQEQHDRIQGFLSYIDASPESTQTLKIYKINYVEAEDIKIKLSQLEVIGIESENFFQAVPSRVTTARTPMNEPADLRGTSDNNPQVVVVEPTNSLMVYASTEQHDRIAAIIGHLDNKMEEIPYQFYPLENQSPIHLATVLTKLIQETAHDEEDKIITTSKRAEEIKLVPDPNTFSLIVYASKKNQEWIAGLIKMLDKRRPQVLIDVALVEISRTDEFDLDLQFATKWPKMQTGDVMSVTGSVVSPFVGGTGEAFSSPGIGTAQGFYSDAHIQALLTAIQSKRYGRILAKPKILVNDGQPGTIETVDKTSVKIESIIIPEEGTQRTTTDFKEYEAGITLTITPNISEGDLLLLQVELDRTDFLQRTDATVPPDTTTSNINTIVTVPDGRTIILGGLLKLNQTKGGTKIPLLGDIPLLGGLFRSTSNTDDESRLYVFLKANILRPDETSVGLPELEKISEKNRATFEMFESKFQRSEDWPGIKSQPMDPAQVLDVE